MTPDWFPDWFGQPVAIIASGPSVKGQNFANLEGRMIGFAIKQNVDICKWAAADVQDAASVRLYASRMQSRIACASWSSFDGRKSA